MKFTMVLTAFCVAAVTAAPGDIELFGRNDCGKGGAPYTRRTNSKCGTGNGHTYCGCDQTGIVKCIDGHWKEIKDCEALSGHQKCHGNGTGAHCGVVLTHPPGL